MEQGLLISFVGKSNECSHHSFRTLTDNASSTVKLSEFLRDNFFMEMLLSCARQTSRKL